MSIVGPARDSVGKWRSETGLKMMSQRRKKVLRAGDITEYLQSDGNDPIKKEEIMVWRRNTENVTALFCCMRGVVSNE